MFQISGVSQTYWTPVVIEVPDGKGKFTKHNIEAQFKRLSQTELDDLYRRQAESAQAVSQQIGAIQRGEVLAQEELRFTDEMLIREVMTGWRLVQDADGNDLEFNDENLTALLEVNPARPTIAAAFFKSIKTSKQKN